MSIKYYLKYFYFIGLNWNLRLACFTLLKEIKGEKKYNIHTIELDRLKTLSIQSENLIHASIYQGANYYLLEKAFGYLQSINANKSIVDFGCGKGRVLVVAAYYGFTKITGIDFAQALCTVATQNIEKVKRLYPLAKFEIICADVVNYRIHGDESVFFFFNPFDDFVMLQVVKNILQSIKEAPRDVIVVYINPVHKEIFLSAGFKEDFYLKKLKYLELSILSKQIDEDDA